MLTSPAGGAGAGACRGNCQSAKGIERQAPHAGRVPVGGAAIACRPAREERDMFTTMSPDRRSRSSTRVVPAAAIALLAWAAILVPLNSQYYMPDLEHRDFIQVSKNSVQLGRALAFGTSTETRTIWRSARLWDHRSRTYRRRAVFMFREPRLRADALAANTLAIFRNRRPLRHSPRLRRLRRVASTTSRSACRERLRTQRRRGVRSVRPPLRCVDRWRFFRQAALTDPQIEAGILRSGAAQAASAATAMTIWPSARLAKTSATSWRLAR